MIRLQNADSGRGILVSPAFIVMAEKGDPSGAYVTIHYGTNNFTIRVRESLDEIERMTRSYFWETAAHG